jgi:hypothetical protein
MRFGNLVRFLLVLIALSLSTACSRQDAKDGLSRSGGGEAHSVGTTIYSREVAPAGGLSEYRNQGRPWRPGIDPSVENPVGGLEARQWSQYQFRPLGRDRSPQPGYRFREDGSPAGESVGIGRSELEDGYAYDRYSMNREYRNYRFRPIEKSNRYQPYSAPLWPGVAEQSSFYQAPAGGFADRNDVPSYLPGAPTTAPMGMPSWRSERSGEFQRNSWNGASLTDQNRYSGSPPKVI